LWGPFLYFGTLVSTGRFFPSARPGRRWNASSSRFILGSVISRHASILVRSRHKFSFQERWLGLVYSRCVDDQEIANHLRLLVALRGSPSVLSAGRTPFRFRGHVVRVLGLSASCGLGGSCVMRLRQFASENSLNVPPLSFHSLVVFF